MINYADDGTTVKLEPKKKKTSEEEIGKLAVLVLH